MKCPRCTAELKSNGMKVYLTEVEKFAKDNGITVEEASRMTYVCPMKCFPTLWFDHSGMLHGDGDVPIYFRIAFESEAFKDNIDRLNQKIAKVRNEDKKKGLQDKVRKITDRAKGKLERGICSACHRFRECRMKQKGMSKCMTYVGSTWKDDMERKGSDEKGSTTD